MLLNYAGTKSGKGHKHTLIFVFFPQQGQRYVRVGMSEHNIVFLVTPEALQFHSTPNTLIHSPLSQERSRYV